MSEDRHKGLSDGPVRKRTRQNTKLSLGGACRTRSVGSLGLAHTESHWGGQGGFQGGERLRFSSSSSAGTGSTGRSSWNSGFFTSSSPPEAIPGHS